ncbi:hypothetical protein NM688_g4620 [Phlebia brevispora]|uniref:Uncharacterized protein n=1 Tax=Phlebia brevispora TaxID=194682 RepID=A0ACC1T249_9APHY|nr:hypothetical protein NM688_g4620 [Phlebia brevispora]
MPTEINDCVQLYAAAAINTVERVRFDGIEVHDAYGSLIGIFIQDLSKNTQMSTVTRSKTDAASYWRSLVLYAKPLAMIIKTGFRVSPWSKCAGMSSSSDLGYILIAQPGHENGGSSIHFLLPRAGAYSETPGSGLLARDRTAHKWGCRSKG